MNTPSLVLPAADGSLELRFHRRLDRWHHALVWQQGDQTWPLLASLEGNDSQPWPPSPPIQELDPHQVDGEKVLLGVGMAGRSHWSLSASRSLNASRSQSQLLLEWACLIHPPTGSLGTTYDVTGADWEFQPGPETLLRYPLPESDAVLSVLRTADTEASWRESPSPQLRLLPVPHSDPPAAPPSRAACRWSLRLSLS